MSIEKVTCFVTRRIDGQDHFALLKHPYAGNQVPDKSPVPMVANMIYSKLSLRSASTSWTSFDRLVSTTFHTSRSSTSAYP